MEIVVLIWERSPSFSIGKEASWYLRFASLYIVRKAMIWLEKRKSYD